MSEITTYTPAIELEAAIGLTGATGAQIARWRRAGLITYRDGLITLVEAIGAAQLRILAGAGMPVRIMRPIVTQYRARLAKVPVLARPAWALAVYLRQLNAAVVLGLEAPSAERVRQIHTLQQIVGCTEREAAHHAPHTAPPAPPIEAPADPQLTAALERLFTERLRVQ